MNVKKALFNIFGPVILAALILITILVMPNSSHKISQKTIYQASLSQSKNIFKGNVVKRAAFEENYVPFLGSSEFSRMDSFHPSSMAIHYDRSYRPFLLGAPGSQSLAQYFGMQGVNAALKGKKAVMVVSPQWFVKKGIETGAFNLYYSNLEAVSWLLHATTSQVDRYAAKRLLTMTAGQNSNLIRKCLAKIADGQELTSFDKTYLKLKYNQLEREDRWFSTLAMNDRIGKIERVADKLPVQEDFSKLDEVAYKMGQKSANNNQFDIYNKFWNKRLKKSWKHLKHKQSHFDYVSSPEFADFELVLNQFKANKMNVIFVIPPVNTKWMAYTGLSQEMLDDFNAKITYQLKSQGFNHIVDLSQDGGVDYFMQDTIHLGWRGWLKMDQAVSPFLSEKQAQPTYHLNKYFFSKEWQKMQGEELSNFLKDK
ncbi:D-alanyl-lipoteichoic acid biosynthesis protein DltD [Ligilactobacillus ceti]|uniref:Protein DltD n=1 Tax=Ligilactobacillus ceti DSM 22408 TaxID=1122146 RepID=A0A0R2KQZ6_9LACO|nr:D-alanyl-lipoteichoic acid biosynthesis protein DltD [Ligilactobacillus ceti]KRN88564.1 protein dltD precursor [Ligilactobacillus ceti DSM 22408]